MKAALGTMIWRQVIKSSQIRSDCKVISIIPMDLVRFRAISGSQERHIGSHIVEFYNVKDGSARLPPSFFRLEASDEEMGPVDG